MSQKNSGPPITQEDNYFAPKNWMKKFKVNSPFLAPFMSKNSNSYIITIIIFLKGIFLRNSTNKKIHKNQMNTKLATCKKPRNAQFYTLGLLFKNGYNYNTHPKSIPNLILHQESLC
jgi:hypothetical protein